MKNFQLDKDADGILLVTFDMPGRSHERAQREFHGRNW